MTPGPGVPHGYGVGRRSPRTQDYPSGPRPGTRSSTSAPSPRRARAACRGHASSGSAPATPRILTSSMSSGSTSWPSYARHRVRIDPSRSATTSSTTRTQRRRSSVGDDRRRHTIPRAHAVDGPHPPRGAQSESDTHLLRARRRLGPRNVPHAEHDHHAPRTGRGRESRAAEPARCRGRRVREGGSNPSQSRSRRHGLGDSATRSRPPRTTNREGSSLGRLAPPPAWSRRALRRPAPAAGHRCASTRNQASCASVIRSTRFGGAVD